MRPLDPRLAPHLRPARAPLVLAMSATLAGGLLTIVQAFAIGTLIVELVQDPAGSSWHKAAGWLAAVVVLRAWRGTSRTPPRPPPPHGSRRRSGSG